MIRRAARRFRGALNVAFPVALEMDVYAEDLVAAWVNARGLGRTRRRFGPSHAPSALCVKLPLDGGENRLLLKISDLHGAHGFAFGLRGVTPTNPLRPLQWSPSFKTGRNKGTNFHPGDMPYASGVKKVAGGRLGLPSHVMMVEKPRRDESRTEAAAPSTGSRFPWLVGVFCAACLGAAAWTWTRYSCVHTVEPSELVEGNEPVGLAFLQGACLQVRAVVSDVIAPYEAGYVDARGGEAVPFARFAVRDAYGDSAELMLEMPSLARPAVGEAIEPTGRAGWHWDNRDGVPRVVDGPDVNVAVVPTVLPAGQPTGAD